MNIRVPIKIMKCAKASFRYKTLSERKGIKALLCCPQRKFRRNKCRNGMKIVTVLYDSSKWTTKKAKMHAKKIVTVLYDSSKWTTKKAKMHAKKTFKRK